MPPESIQLEVVTLESSLVNEAVSEVQVPGRDGYLGILPGHTPLLSELGIDALSYKQGGSTMYIAVFGGLVEVLPERVIVLADAAERADEIDVAAARADADKLRKQLAGPGDPSTNWDEMLTELARAEARIKAATGPASGVTATAPATADAAA
jgi:F-type H+-transporting ATPase subunit epsilon